MGTSGHPTTQPYSRAGLLAKLTGAAVLAVGALLYGQGTSQLATLTLGTAGRVLVAGASAPAWSDAGLSYTSGVLAIAGSAPVTPSAGQVLIGGGAIKAGGAVSCTSLTVSGALGAFQYGAQPVGGEDVAVWSNKTSAVSVARGFQSYITHSGTGGSTAYDAVASTSATAGHNVCYQGVSKATGAATPSYLSFAFGSGDSTSSGTIANAYGYYWGGWTGAGTITNKWAFFNASADKSYYGGDTYYNGKIAIGVSTATALSWSLTINNPTTPLIAIQRADADMAYITNAATVLSGKPTTDLAIVHANTGAVWIGGNGVGMLKVDGTAVTCAAGISCAALTSTGKITTVSAVPGSFDTSSIANLEAAIRTWLAAQFT